MDGQGQHPDAAKAERAAAPASPPPADDLSGAGVPVAERAPAAAGEASTAPAADPAGGRAGLEVSGPEAGVREAPPLGGRIHYLLGGTLPPRYSAWVSRDLTGPGWRYRQALRPFFLMLPFAVVFALLPGQVSVRVTIVVFLLLSGVGLGFATSGYFRNRRLEQHNFPPVFPPSD
ncbi:DUF5313 family protein [Parafrankia elaeagni]|uniref:DUF5313 family protein n=1 Tax=Parafrankia elaeagni TaxID=222534 RepID=UPI00035D55DA|nr:DUF5313 family protein [Parafrankia elaeagni]